MTPHGELVQKTVRELEQSDALEVLRHGLWIAQTQESPHEAGFLDDAGCYENNQ